MRSLALFDLDDTLIDRRAAFNIWAEEFVTARGLDDAALTFLLMADAHHSGPMDSFFATICHTFDLDEPPDQMWKQYRRRMPELASCRTENIDALKRLRRAGWRIGIVTTLYPLIFAQSFSRSTRSCVEPRGLEPLTPALQRRCSAS